MQCQTSNNRSIKEAGIINYSYLYHTHKDKRFETKEFAYE
jgi:hypothetical protein